MKIRFIVDIDAGKYPFVIDTNRLPYSIGNKEVALNEFEIIETDAPLTNASIRLDDAYVCSSCGKPKRRLA